MLTTSHGKLHHKKHGVSFSLYSFPVSLFIVMVDRLATNYTSPGAVTWGNSQLHLHLIAGHGDFKDSLFSCR